MEILDQDYKPRNIQYASFSDRLIAGLIDGIVIGMISSIAYMLSFGMIGSVAIGLIYYVYMETSPAQSTIGKQAMGIYVANEDGSPIEVVQAIIRCALRYLCFALFFVGVFAMFFTEKRQCLHELITKTVTLKKEKF